MRTKLSLLTAALIASLNTQADTLQDIYQAALLNDHQLKADEAAYLAGKESLTLGRAGLLPQITAGAGYTDSETDSYTELGSIVADGTSESSGTSWNVGVSQALFDLGTWYSYKSGQSQSALAAEQFAADQQAMIVRVAEAYFNVLRAIDTLTASEAEEKAIGSQLEQTRQRFEVGLTAITDVHEAQAAFDSAVAERLIAEGQLGINYEQLEVITGISSESISPLKANFPVIDPVPAARQPWVEFSLSNNRDLRVSRLNAESARYSASAAKAGHYPTLRASYQYTDNDFDGNNVAGISNASDTQDSTIGLTLSMPLYTGGSVSGQRRQANQRAIQADEISKLTERNIVQSARSFHLAVTTNVSRVKARKQSIISAQSAVDATQAGYEVGTRNLVDVLLAQQTLYQAQRDYSNALYDYVINQFRLRQVAGSLSPQDVLEINQWLDQVDIIKKSDYENRSYDSRN